MELPKEQAMRVGLFVACYVDAFHAEVGIATLELLERFGIEVEYHSLPLHLHDGGCGQHIRIEIGHDPQRPADDQGDDQDAEGKRDHIVGIVRPGTDVQEKYQVNPHLRDGEHGKPGGYARLP
jgi:hypothetical protein